MKLSDFDYSLDEKRIAQKPRKPRDSSKLLVIDRKNEIYHSRFRKITNFFRSDDVLVINETKTIKARLFGKKRSGAKIEILLLKKLSNDNDEWEALTKPAKKVKKGDIIEVGYANLLISEELQEGIRKVRFLNSGSNSVIKQFGRIPLPPYIKRSDDKNDKAYYQTVFAKDGNSVAAPTAGLHFTKRVIKEIEKCGVEVIRIRLDIGIGTFKPVISEDIDMHKMHKEEYFITKDSAKKLNDALNQKKNIIAVGTTTIRALEDQVLRFNEFREGSFETDIFIREPFEFRAVKGLVTNFHLPKTTLLMLVCAFKSREIILKAYEEAMKLDYLFFSYGDAMLLLNR